MITRILDASEHQGIIGNVLPANKRPAQTFPACVVTQAAARCTQALANSDQANESIIPDDTFLASELDLTEHREQSAVSEPQLLVEASDFSISQNQLVCEMEVSQSRLGMTVNVFMRSQGY